MKRLVMAAAILAALATGSASAAGCNWSMKNDSLRYTQDKKWHFEQTAMGTMALMALNDAAKLDLSDTQIFWLGVLPGFIHELGTACDGNRPASQRAFSHQDMVWNMLGAAAGVAVGNGARLMLAPRSVQLQMEF